MRTALALLLLLASAHAAAAACYARHERIGFAMRTTKNQFTIRDMMLRTVAAASLVFFWNAFLRLYWN